MSVKLCPSCKEIKPVAEFYKRSNGRPSAYCKECQKARVLEYNRTHPEKRENSIRKHAEKKAREAAYRNSNPPRYQVRRVFSDIWQEYRWALLDTQGRKLFNSTTWERAMQSACAFAWADRRQYEQDHAFKTAETLAFKTGETLRS